MKCEIFVSVYKVRNAKPRNKLKYFCNQAMQMQVCLSLKEKVTFKSREAQKHLSLQFYTKGRVSKL